MKNIEIRKIKEVGLKLPEPVKTLILSEPETLKFDEFMVKIATWDKLLKMRPGGEK